ncbi:hypothetical protein DEO72_LG11g1108 [Vigna unguiculata]|uniref:Uncharacterized protein n=1 Tax=Vigna unguiculata TaxID=3917 RepID=A0A4D6NK28_VIGUN|nr:hypothetical protein DEO72_LG11g1108 [Vigna unguiculata]
MLHEPPLNVEEYKLSNMFNFMEEKHCEVASSTAKYLAFEFASSLHCVEANKHKFTALIAYSSSSAPSKCAVCARPRKTPNLLLLLLTPPLDTPNTLIPPSYTLLHLSSNQGRKVSGRL